MKNKPRLRLLAALSAALMLQMPGAAAFSVPAQAADSGTQSGAGDADGSGQTDVADIVLLQKYILGLPVPESHALHTCDLDSDGAVDVIDLGLLKRLVLAGTAPDPEQPTEPDIPTEPTTEPPTEPDVPTEPDTSYIPATVSQFGNFTPSSGECRMLTICVDFADTHYSDEALAVDALEAELYGNSGQAPYESLTAWYDRASYGNLHISGSAFYYTCQGNMTDYMPEGRLFEKMAMEVLSGLDSQINYADYDGNGDGVIDCIAFTVPLDNADDAAKEYWWGCTATWWENPGFTVDGMEITKYMIIDLPPYASQMQGLKSQLTHEMGHSIGLPDYYLYNSSDDWEGFKGDAGHERMDDSIGDFSSFSKLMYGWLRESEVQWYSGSSEQTFTLKDASEQGSCLILPISSTPGDVTSEYFIVEYTTLGGNNAELANWWVQDTGVRIFHVNAELYTTSWGDTNFMYEGFGENYMGDDKIRVARLVNDGNGFYHAGDVCTFGTTNFAAYDTDGNQTVDTGYTVTIGELTDGAYTVTVSR